MRFFRRGGDEHGAEDDQALGWDAIERALRQVHGDAEPVHRALTPGLAFGSPLQGISAYRAADHWHLVTFGLTELFETASDELGASGFGYELTMRVARDPAEDRPPEWPFDLLAGVAQQARNGQDFAVGHRIDVGGPITGEPDCALSALAFVSDPALPTWTQGPAGSFEFYELVGITEGELREMQRTSTDAVVRSLMRTDPLLITDPRRSV